METNQHLFKELEAAEKLFSEGSIKNAQKKLRGVLKDSKSLKKIPNKLRHKINAAISKSRYFDEISSFATNPKRNELLNMLDDLIKNPNENPRKHAHKIHEIQTQWQVLDLSSKPASKSQWLNFNDLTKKAWEPCKEYFDEIKQIKVNNALNRKEIINNINNFVHDNSNNWPNSKNLIIFLQKTFKDWQKYAPVLNEDLDQLKKLYFDARKPINDEIKRQEDENKEKKVSLIKKVAEISSDDNEKNISEFKKLKDEWSNIGPAGKKNEKKMWDEFNKNADKFFVERKQKLTDEVNKICDLNKKLNNDEISISEVKSALNEIKDAKNTKEFKYINKDIKSKINDINIAKKKDKSNAYANIYNVLLGKIEIDNAPSNFKNTIQNSLDNSESNIYELNYACVKLEILAGIDSLKKDQSIRNNIQLEMLSNKFNKNNNLTTNDMDSLINHFINNFSKNDAKTTHANIWKRITKCIDKLIS